jgi:hypothetical protein
LDKEQDMHMSDVQEEDVPGKSDDELVIFLIGTSQMTTIEENITQVLKCHYYDSSNLVRYRHFVPDKFYFIISIIKIF